MSADKFLYKMASNDPFEHLIELVGEILPDLEQTNNVLQSNKKALEVILEKVQKNFASISEIVQGLEEGNSGNSGHRLIPEGRGR